MLECKADFWHRDLFSFTRHSCHKSMGCPLTSTLEAAHLNCRDEYCCTQEPFIHLPKFPIFPKSSHKQDQTRHNTPHATQHQGLMLEAIHHQMDAPCGDGPTTLQIQLCFCGFHTQKYLFKLFSSRAKCPKTNG